MLTKTHSKNLSQQPNRLMKPSLCVVYLAREPQAIVPFLDSYQRHPAGVDHKLLFLKKGSHVVLPPEATSMPNHLEYAIADVGCGLRAVSVACRRLDFDYYCCLNSWTQIAADDWLLKLFCAACMPAAGIVGATGSAETSYQLR